MQSLDENVRIRVQYTGQMRLATGASEELVELPSGSSVACLIDRLARSGDGDRSSFLHTRDGLPLRSLLIVVNDTAVPSSDFARQHLNNDDVVTFYPPIAGG